MPVYTKTDIENIAGHMRYNPEERPFAVITGAGCSVSAGIPLAAALVEEINTKDQFAHCIAGLTDAERQDYGRCMAQLSKSERNDLLGPYLENSSINWAHIALASLMKAGYVGKVLTFNFDNVLARACGLNGLYPAIYDFVSGVADTFDHIVSPSIIHLHG